MHTEHISVADTPGVELLAHRECISPTSADGVCFPKRVEHTLRCQQAMSTFTSVASHQKKHFILAFLDLEIWYLIVVLIWISLITSKVEHLFICVLAFQCPSFENSPFRSLAYFSTELPVFFLGFRRVLLYSDFETFVAYMCCKHLLFGLAFHFFHVAFL